MNALFFIIIGIFIGVLAMLGYHRRIVRDLEKDIARTQKELAEEEKDIREVSNLDEFNERQARKKAERKRQALELFDTQAEVQNNDVAELLDVSGVSAYTYLEELEQEGEIKQVGKHGRSVVYKKASKPKKDIG